MANLLAILLSLAVMLTGATAPVDAPVSRTLVLSNLSVRHNEEEVTLAPYASLGVMADNDRALLDFFIGNGDETYLPLQLAIDESGLVAHSDHGNTNVAISAEALEEMMGGIETDAESQQVFELLGDYMSAYGELFKLMEDQDAMASIQKKAQDVYDEMVDRGEGTPGTGEYDGATYDVTTYEYTLTAGQIGALTDAVYTVDDRLANYAAAYFRMLQAMPEDSGLNGFDSFQSFLEGFGDITMDITESIAEEGLNITDAILHVTVPGMDAPVDFVIHSVLNGDEKTGEVTANVDADGTAVSLYIDSVQTGRDIQMTVNMTVNPSEDGEAADEEIIGGEDDPTAIYVEEDEEAPLADDVEVEYDDAILADGEGDGADAIYFTADFDRVYDENFQKNYDSLSYAIDLAAQNAHFAFSIEGGDDECHLNGELAVGEDSYGFELDAQVSDAPIEDRTDAAAATTIEDTDFTPVLTSLATDVQNLYGDESVQKLIALAQSAAEAMTSVESVGYEVDPEEFESGEDEYVAPELLGTPQFNWLPEGYEVEEINVEDEFQQASCTLVNPETYDTIYIDISAVMSFANENDHYVLGEDGSLDPIEGVILNAEIGDGYSMYSVDDGTLSISVFPGGSDVTVEDVARILTGITFD